jgi:hypothetical protein
LLAHLRNRTNTTVTDPSEISSGLSLGGQKPVRSGGSDSSD